MAQRQVESSTNEITSLPSLLDPLDLQGRLVTLDALHTHASTAHYLVENKHADYLFIVKDNQSTLKKDIEDLGMLDSPPYHQTTDKGHGRLEIHQIWTSTDLNTYLDFPYVKQVLCIRREVTHLKTNKKTVEIVYGITSSPPEKTTPEQLLQLNRGHWGIENRLHYVRDVTFDEDRSQIRTKNAPEIMASLRNFVISLLRWFKKTNIAEILREMAARTHLSLCLLGL